MVTTCWLCNATPRWGLLEDDHGNPGSLTTDRLKSAADAVGVDIGRAVANATLALSHYDPAFTPTGDEMNALVKAYLTRQDVVDAAPKVCPCGLAIRWDPLDGPQHLDGSISHEDGESVSDKVFANDAGYQDAKALDALHKSIGSDFAVFLSELGVLGKSDDEALAELHKSIRNAATVDDFLASLSKGDEEVAQASLIKAEDEDHFLLMVAYSPNRMPLRGADKKIDVASPRVIELGCWRFMATGARTGMWHKPGYGDQAICVENYIWRGPDWDVNGDGSLIIREGDWLVGFLLSDFAWGEFKAGHIGGVSMQGGASRKDTVSADTRERIGSNL